MRFFSVSLAGPADKYAWRHSQPSEEARIVCADNGFTATDCPHPHPPLFPLMQVPELGEIPVLDLAVLEMRLSCNSKATPKQREAVAAAVEHYQRSNTPHYSVFLEQLTPDLLDAIKYFGLWEHEEVELEVLGWKNDRYSRRYWR